MSGSTLAGRPGADTSTSYIPAMELIRTQTQVRHRPKLETSRTPEYTQTKSLSENGTAGYPLRRIPTMVPRSQDVRSGFKGSRWLPGRASLRATLSWWSGVVGPAENRCWYDWWAMPKTDFAMTAHNNKLHVRLQFLKLPGSNTRLLLAGHLLFRLSVIF